MPEFLRQRGDIRLSELPTKEKFQILNNNKLRESGKRSQNGYMFKMKNVQKHGKSAKYIHYSCTKDQLYCLSCSIFSTASANHIPTKWIEGFSNWKKLNTDQGLDTHLKSKSHKESWHAAEEFLESEKSSSKIDNLYKTKKSKEIEENSQMLLSSIRAVRLCGKQGLSLRGHFETYNPDDPAHNRGTFAGIMELLGQYDETVQTVLTDVKNAREAGKKISATIMGKEVQNEIISIFGNKIKDSVVESVKKSGFYTIISDECTAFNSQYLTLGRMLSSLLFSP